MHRAAKRGMQFERVIAQVATVNLGLVGLGSQIAKLQLQQPHHFQPHEGVFRFAPHSQAGFDILALVRAAAV